MPFAPCVAFAEVLNCRLWLEITRNTKPTDPWVAKWNAMANCITDSCFFFQPSAFVPNIFQILPTNPRRERQYTTTDARPALVIFHPMNMFASHQTLFCLWAKIINDAHIVHYDSSLPQDGDDTSSILCDGRSGSHRSRTICLLSSRRGGGACLCTSVACRTAGILAGADSAPASLIMTGDGSISPL